MNYMNNNSGINASLRGALALAALCLHATVAIAQAPPGGPPGGGASPGGPPGAAPPSAGGRRFALAPLPANAPQPSSDPRSFDGSWYHADSLVFQMTTDVFGNPTPLNAAGNKVMARRLKSLTDGTPFLNAAGKCFPVGQSWQWDINFPFNIRQSKDLVEIFFEEYHGHQTISLDPAKAPPPGYMGRSVGHWDGNTLVVENTGFKDAMWLDVFGTPASKNARLTQRIRKVKSDQWYLEVLNTIDDPTYYTRPWSWMRSYVWRPDMTLQREYNCELQTGAKDGLDPSLVPEPKDAD